MLINNLRLRKRFSVAIISGVLLLSTAATTTVFAEEATNETTQTVNTYVTIDKVNVRTEPSTDSTILSTVGFGTEVLVKEYSADSWSVVNYNGVDGYMKSDFIKSKEEYEAIKSTKAELLPWTEAKNIVTIGTPLEVYDVRSGLTYYVKSFSNGNHADVEPITKEDTNTMLKSYGGSWKWDARAIIVTVNGRKMAASINGMPHGGGVNAGNGMNGQICIHFKDSTTHNGNKSHERDHQDRIIEAYNSTFAPH